MGLTYTVLQAENLDSVAGEIEKADLIVDALFGTGFKGVPGNPSPR